MAAPLRSTGHGTQPPAPTPPTSAPPGRSPSSRLPQSRKMAESTSGSITATSPTPPRTAWSSWPMPSTSSRSITPATLLPWGLEHRNLAQLNCLEVLLALKSALLASPMSLRAVLAPGAYKGVIMMTQSRSCRNVCWACACALLVLTGGCEMLIDVPTVSSDGSISGGAPKLHSLLKLVSESRPKPAEGNPQGVGYTINLYPATHIVTLEGYLPPTQKAVGASYVMIASLDSGESAWVALIVETAVGIPGEKSVRQTTRSFSWEGGKWVSKSLSEMQVRDARR